MGRRPRLVLLSFTVLFIELALIRWTGSNIFDLSHFTNFVLLGSFLGIGIGFLRSHSTLDLSPWAPVALSALVLFVLAFPTGIDSSSEQLIFIGGTPSGLPIWVSLPVIFVAVAAAMATAAEGLARTFITFEPLEAYSLDIAGSLLGIVAFSALSFAGAPPVAWGVIAVGLLLFLSPQRPRHLHIAAAIAMVTVLGVESTRPGLSWSPYNKLRALTVTVDGVQLTQVSANGIPHQLISPAAADARLPGIPHGAVYDQLTRTPEDVLIIGAGGGPDTAIALARGARHVDAVEIDPRIDQIGREVNPDHPDKDPRVSVHIEDGREFLRRTTRSYDLIILALTDSVTLVAGQSSIRLESYLFTAEAMRAMRDHLKPGGVFAELNFYRERWLVDRLAGGLSITYGQDPCVRSVGTTGHLALLMASSTPSSVRCSTPWQHVADFGQPATDDHPFPYLRQPGIPGFYLLTLLLVVLASLLMVRVTAGPLRPLFRYADMFLMGAAFLLLETKNVVQFALLFGTTWFVNALVFAAILGSVFLAVQLARRVTLPRPQFLFIGLFVALAVAWVVPQESLLSLDALPRFLAAAVLAFSPVFFANLVFAQRFQNVESSSEAFAANLVGAILGGALEYTALITGYRALLLVIALLYGGAFLARGLGLRQEMGHR